MPAITLDAIKQVVAELVEKPLRNEFPHICEVRVSQNSCEDLLEICVVTGHPGNYLRFYRDVLSTEVLYEEKYSLSIVTVIDLIDFACERLRQLIRIDQDNSALDATFSALDATFVGSEVWPPEPPGGWDPPFFVTDRSDPAAVYWDKKKAGKIKKKAGKIKKSPPSPKPNPTPQTRWQTLADEMSEDDD